MAKMKKVQMMRMTPRTAPTIKPSPSPDNLHNPA
jgi:hypothetical protein